MYQSNVSFNIKVCNQYDTMRLLLKSKYVWYQAKLNWNEINLKSQKK